MEGEEFQFSHGQNIRTLKYVPRTKALGTQTDDGLAIVLTYVILLRIKKSFKKQFLPPMPSCKRHSHLAKPGKMFRLK